MCATPQAALHRHTPRTGPAACLMRDAAHGIADDYPYIFVVRCCATYCGIGEGRIVTSRLASVDSILRNSAEMPRIITILSPKQGQSLDSTLKEAIRILQNNAVLVDAVTQTPDRHRANSDHSASVCG